MTGHAVLCKQGLTGLDIPLDRQGWLEIALLARRCHLQRDRSLDPVGIDHTDCQKVGFRAPTYFR
jgi:hypothetical protein